MSYYSIAPIIVGIMFVIAIAIEWRIRRSNIKDDDLVDDRYCITDNSGDCVSTHPRCMHNYYTELHKERQ